LFSWSSKTKIIIKIDSTIKVFHGDKPHFHGSRPRCRGDKLYAGTGLDFLDFALIIKFGKIKKYFTDFIEVNPCFHKVKQIVRTKKVHQ